jgi:hypothetical protein
MTSVISIRLKLLQSALLHNRVMCRVGGADQHCEKHSRFMTRRGAIF